MRDLSVRRRGVVLLFSIAILAILAILATTFASMTRMERDVSRNYVDHVRSKLLAQAGIERAVQEIRTAIQGSTILAANFSAAEDIGKPWIYGKPMGGGTVFYEPSIPIEKAIFCSFSTNPTTGANRTVKLADRTNQKAVPANPLDAGYGPDDFGVSGAMAGTYTPNGDFYSLKVIDAASKICINGPDSNDDNPNPAVAAVVTRLLDKNQATGVAKSSTLLMLNSLSVILAQEKGLAFQDLGTRISNLRVQTGRNFIRLEEIMPALGATAAQQQTAFDLVRPYVTTAVWMDSETLSPDSLEHGTTQNPRNSADPNLIYNPVWRTFRTVGVPNPGGTRVAEETIPDGPTLYGACPTTSGSDRAVSDIPSRWMSATNPGATQTPAPGNPAVIECRTPRVPVNVNTAPREVLQAVLTNIQAGFLNRTSGPTYYFGDGFDATNTVIVSAGGPPGIAKNIALAIVARRNELVRSSRKYGFATWYDFNSFIDAIDNNAALAALVPPSAIGPVTLDANPIKAKAIKDAIKANANPNSHINKFNPDRAFGSRYGDTDKADLTQWTTEFCFNSDGCFEIEAIGRVCSGPNGAGQMPIVAETVIRTSLKVFDVYRISSQKGFVANQIGGSGAGGPLVTYPEHMSDIGGATPSSRVAAAADYDGYLMLDTVDTAQSLGGMSFFAKYDTDLGADAAGPAEQGTSLVSNQTGGNPSAGGQSELFTDGFFNHRTRRYATYANGLASSAWGAPSIGPVDDYVRNARADQKISMNQGTIDMWVKPTWAATGNSPAPGETPDFATQRANSADNPQAVSRRTLFSVGAGTTAVSYPSPLNSSTLEVSDNRIYMYAVYDVDGVYLMGSECTRLCDVPNGLVAQWYTALNMGAHKVMDRSTQSKNHTNWKQLRSNAAADPEPKYSVSTSSWNPKGWRYAGGWHHVRMCWSGQMSWMFVDGLPSGDDPLTGFRAPGVLPNIAQSWSLFIGSNRFKDDETNGYPCNADATIDAVKIYTTAISNAAFTPPQRYVSNGTYEGKIGRRTNVLDPDVKPFDVAGKVACVSWTVLMPRFSGTPTSCTLEVGKGGSYNAISPDMSGGVPLELAGRGTNVPNLNVATGDNLTYKVTMTSGLPDQLASPILDDVTVTVIPSAPRFLYYSIE